MIFDGKKLRYRAPHLSACNAARSFTRGAPRTASHKRNWIPLVLRWRKRRAFPKETPARSFVSSTNVASFPQFHFYFTQFLTRQGRSLASSKPGLRLPGLHRQITRNYKSVDLVRAKGRSSNAGAYRPHGTAGNPIEGRANRETKRQAESRYPAHTAVNTIARTFSGREPTLFRRTIAERKKLLPQKADETRTTTPSRTSPAFVFETRSRSRSDHRRTPAARMRAETSSAVLPAPGATFLPNLFHQREELVWRRVTRSMVDGDERSAHRKSANQAFKAEPVHGEVSQIASQVSSLANAAAGRAIASFDPAMVDRLTDDIIRRVEKRARIERERRGIS